MDPVGSRWAWLSTEADRAQSAPGHAHCSRRRDFVSRPTLSRCGARFWATVAVSEPWVRIARFGRPVLLLVYICTVASLDSIAAVLPSRSGASVSHRSHAVQPSGLSPIAAHIDHGCPVAHHQERLAQLVLRHERVRNRTGILKELAKRHRAQVDATFA